MLRLNVCSAESCPKLSGELLSWLLRGLNVCSAVSCPKLSGKLLS